MSPWMRAAALLVLAVALNAEARVTLWMRTYVSPADGTVRVYDVGVPSSYDGSRRVPAILFLHGRGAGKSSFEISQFLDPADAAGMIEIFWQGRFVPEIGAFSTQYVDGKNGVPDETDVLACLDDALAAYAIDPDRVSLAGFSQGGKGALLIGLKNPDRFAAVVEGAGPSDAFQGQLWSPTFPDFASAAGGPAASATGETLAMWYAQSPRFLLQNARNLPVALFHGTADNVVPDSPLLFPYRNTHHIADTPGFRDARGPTPTFSELHAADPDGYPFAVTYVAGATHEWAAFPGAQVFAFVNGKSRPARPLHVIGRTYESRAARFYWLSLARTTPPDGRPAGVTADLAPQSVHVATLGDQALTLDLAAAALDAGRALSVSLDGASHVLLRLHGPFPPALRVTKNGVVLGPEAVGRDGADLLLDMPAGGAATFAVAPPPAGPLDESDLLVPAMVDAPGRGGARYRTELVLANLSAGAVSVEALLLSSPAGAPIAIDVPAGSTHRLDSADLLARFGLAELAAPMRLRVVSGDPSRLFASARVFNDTDSGTYGLSFPVLPARTSLVAAGETANFFGGAPAHPSRTNLSLFAPFEAASGTLTVLDQEGVEVRSLEVALAPGERRQLNDLFAGIAAPARLTLAVSSGRIQAYATVIDEASTNDPFRSPALLGSRAATRFTIPAVASSPGRAGARFTSDLFLSSISTAPLDVTVTFLPRAGGAPLRSTLTLPPGAGRVVEDVVAALFPAAPPAAGALALTADLPFQAFAVTRSDSERGPASQDLPAVRPGEEITASAPAVFAGVTESSRARSNLVLVNVGPATQVALTLHAGDGSRGTVRVPLAQGEVRQLDSFASLFPGPALEDGALVVAPDSGALFAAAVRIDNTSNDPSGLPPVSFAAP